MLSTEDHPLRQDIFLWFYHQEYRDLRNKYQKKLKTSKKRLFLKKHLGLAADHGRSRSAQEAAQKVAQKPAPGFLQALLLAIF